MRRCLWVGSFKVGALLPVLLFVIAVAFILGFLRLEGRNTMSSFFILLFLFSVLRVDLWWWGLHSELGTGAREGHIGTGCMHTSGSFCKHSSAPLYALCWCGAASMTFLCLLRNGCTSGSSEYTQQWWHRCCLLAVPACHSSHLRSCGVSSGQCGSWRFLSF